MDLPILRQSQCLSDSNLFESTYLYLKDDIYLTSSSNFLNYVIDTEIEKDDGKVILVQTRQSVNVTGHSLSNFYLNFENNTVFFTYACFFRGRKASKVLFAVNLLCIWSLQPVSSENCIMISSSSKSCMTPPYQTL